MVDIIVTYLNERDPKWQEDFKYWKEKEIKEGKAEKSNRQAFGKERTREWDTFKYWFRAVENNCPWVNKVFLIVQNERHIPKWLDTTNPKLRVVYHEEYIPKEFLPTFNAMTIGIYVPYIEDLSNYYIACDDDYYFINKIEKDHFFKYGLPIHKKNPIQYELYGEEYLNGTDGVFYHTLNNSLLFEQHYEPRIKYAFYHLPEARIKSFEKEILTKYKEEIDKSNSYSKFRNKHNICPNIFSDLLKITGRALIKDPYRNSCYCNLNSDVNFDDFWDKDMVCFNDTERLDDYDKTKQKWIDFLERKFPNKSSFEKE